LKKGEEKRESKRGEASLKKPSPSPWKERGIKGVRLNKQALMRGKIVHRW